MRVNILTFKFIWFLGFCFKIAYHKTPSLDSPYCSRFSYCRIPQTSTHFIELSRFLIATLASSLKPTPFDRYVFNLVFGECSSTQNGLFIELVIRFFLLQTKCCFMYNSPQNIPHVPGLFIKLTNK